MPAVITVWCAAPLASAARYPSSAADSVLATKANNAYTQYQEPHLAAAYGILIMLLSLLSTALFLVMLPVRTGRETP